MIAAAADDERTNDCRCNDARATNRWQFHVNAQQIGVGRDAIDFIVSICAVEWPDQRRASVHELQSVS